jgi:hypothetical protein
VAFIKQHFVPVVITVHGECKDAEGAFWKSFCKDYAWITGAAHGVTASGKILCAEPGRSSCGGRRVCDPMKSFDKWKALPEEERRPGAVVVEDLKEMDPKFPKRPAGSLMLKGYNRPLERGADGQIRRLKEYWDCQELSADSVNWHKFADPEPGRTWVWLSKEQWQAIVPANPAAGAAFPMPEAAASRLVRLPILNTIY